LTRRPGHERLSEPAWTDLLDRLRADPVDGAAAVFQALAPLRLTDAGVVRETEQPAAISMGPDHLRTLRHAAWFAGQWRVIAEDGWAAAAFGLACRGEAISDQAARLSTMAQAAGADAADQALLAGAAEYADWLAHEVWLARALSTHSVAPEGPVFIPGDLKEVRVVGGPEFHRMSFKAHS